MAEGGALSAEAYILTLVALVGSSSVANVRLTPRSRFLTESVVPVLAGLAVGTLFLLLSPRTEQTGRAAALLDPLAPPVPPTPPAEAPTDAKRAAPAPAPAPEPPGRRRLLGEGLRRAPAAGAGSASSSSAPGAKECSVGTLGKLEACIFDQRLACQQKVRKSCLNTGCTEAALDAVLKKQCDRQRKFEEVCRRKHRWKCGDYRGWLAHTFSTPAPPRSAAKGRDANLTGDLNAVEAEVLDASDVTVLPTRGFVFSERIFFTFLLPPIVFSAGLELDVGLFRKNIGAILAHGVVGTLFSTAVIAIGCRLMLSDDISVDDSLALGAILSSTDTVAVVQLLDPAQQPLLFSVVFGEGMFNDIVSVFLLRTFEGIAGEGSNLGAEEVALLVVRAVYLLVMSGLVGVVAGRGYTWVRRLACAPTGEAELEVLLMLLFAYSSHLVSELFGASSIASIFTCGVTVAIHAKPELSRAAEALALHVAKMVAETSATAVYVYLGMDVLDLQKWQHVQFVPVLKVYAVFVLCVIVGRTLCVVPVSSTVNLFRRTVGSERLKSGEVAVAYWAGLMRGVVAVALCYRQFANVRGDATNTSRATILSATLLLMLTSVIVVGLGTKPLMEAMLRGGRCDAGGTELAPIRVAGRPSVDDDELTSPVQRIGRGSPHPAILSSD